MHCDKESNLMQKSWEWEIKINVCYSVAVFSVECSCTSLTDLPEGSAVLANSLLHLNAVGVEQAIVGPTGTVKDAEGLVK